MRPAAALIAALVLLRPGAVLAEGAAHPLPLMPWPQSVTVQPGATPIGGRVAVTWQGFHDAVLDGAFVRFAGDLADSAGQARGPGPLALTIHVAADDPGRLTPAAREAYRLAIDGGGVRLDADGPAGVLRGLATLRQLVARGDGGFLLPHLTIEDRPRFAWRGLMLDPVRHFLSIAALERQIDAMERMKLNVLHLHLSDNEGFRVESKRFPRLNQVVGEGRFYTQAEVRGLVAYAAARGVRIVPEFDMPGHVGAIVAAYPELASGPVNPKDRIGLMGAALDPTKPQTLAFVKALLGEMAPLFPDGYLHLGGDEVPAAAWTGNPAIAAEMAARKLDVHGLQARFFDQTTTIARRLGKTPIGWDEVARGDIAPDVTVQVWRSSAATAVVTGRGAPAIVSAGYYLDLLRPGAAYYATDPLDLQATPPTLPGDVLGPPPTGPLTPEQAGRVLGAEATLWSEVVSEEMLDGRLWPRAALLAERFWSAPEVRDPADASHRLVPVMETLRRGGLQDGRMRRAMAARLAPQDAEALDRLASGVGPVRNFGRLWAVFDALRHGRRPSAPELNTLADVAAPDSVEVHRLNAGVAAYLAGDKGEAAVLRAQLAAWRDNHPRFVRAAGDDPALTAAIPVSADLAALSEAGLQALDALDAGRRLDAAWRAPVDVVLKRQAEAEAASSAIPKVQAGEPLPPASLLIIAVPPIARLIDAASPPVAAPPS